VRKEGRQSEKARQRKERYISHLDWSQLEIRGTLDTRAKEGGGADIIPLLGGVRRTHFRSGIIEFEFGECSPRHGGSSSRVEKSAAYVVWESGVGPLQWSGRLNGISIRSDYLSVYPVLV